MFSNVKSYYRFCGGGKTNAPIYLWQEILLSLCLIKHLLQQYVILPAFFFRQGQRHKLRELYNVRVDRISRA